jgi:3-methyladenine DNA glycosylase AlkD
MTKTTRKKAAKRVVKRAVATPEESLDERLDAALAWIARTGKKSVVAGMARYGIPSGNAAGIAVGDLKRHAKTLGTDHELAVALFESGGYEARLLTAFIGDPARLTRAQMDRWCRAFDNWAVCDTLCFNFFDRSPHAFACVEAWTRRKPEFEKRAAFALLACLALHDRDADDARFEAFLPTIAAAANDERNFVWKAVSWALRAIGERSLALNRRALALARELADSEDATKARVGKDVLRELAKPAVAKRLAKR